MTNRGLGRGRSALAFCLTAWSTAAGPASPQGASVIVEGLEGRAVRLSSPQIAALPRQRIRVVQHGAGHDFEGPLLADILSLAGAPLGPALRGPALADVVTIEARDGYVVALALADVDPAMQSSRTILADAEDGAPLSVSEGPFRLIVESDLRPARAERMVSRIRVLAAPQPLAPPQGQP